MLTPPLAKSKIISRKAYLEMLRGFSSPGGWKAGGKKKRFARNFELVV